MKISEKMKFSIFLFSIYILIKKLFQFHYELTNLRQMATYSQGRAIKTDGIKCLKNHFKDILLLVNFNEPFYSNIPIITSLYYDVFPSLVFYGTNKSTEYNVTVVDTHKGFFAYIVIAHAMRHYPNYTGYLLINDDVLLNPWNIVSLDKNRIWEGPKWPITVGNYSKFEQWYWWNSRWGLDSCKKAIDDMQGFYHNLQQAKDSNIENKFSKIYQNNYDLNSAIPDFMLTLQENTRDSNHSNNRSSQSSPNVYKYCHRGRSDVVYVPRKHFKFFIIASNFFRANGVFLEIAFPTLLRMTEPHSSFEHLDGIYLPGRVRTAPVSNPLFLWQHYHERLVFIHPLKLQYGANSTINHVILKTFYKRYLGRYTNC